MYHSVYQNQWCLHLQMQGLRKKDKHLAYAPYTVYAFLHFCLTNLSVTNSATSPQSPKQNLWELMEQGFYHASA